MILTFLLCWFLEFECTPAPHPATTLEEKSYLPAGGPRGRVVKAAYFIACHLTAVGSSLARVTCETSQVLLAGGQVVFLEDLQFSPTL